VAGAAVVDGVPTAAGGGAVRLMQAAPAAASARSQKSLWEDRSMRGRVAVSDAHTKVAVRIRRRARANSFR